MHDYPVTRTLLSRDYRRFLEHAYTPEAALALHIVPEQYRERFRAVCEEFSGNPYLHQVYFKQMDASAGLAVLDASGNLLSFYASNSPDGDWVAVLKALVPYLQRKREQLPIDYPTLGDYGLRYESLVKWVGNAKELYFIYNLPNHYTVKYATEGSSALRSVYLAIQDDLEAIQKGTFQI